jgi:hypothetical protein
MNNWVHGYWHKSCETYNNHDSTAESITQNSLRQWNKDVLLKLISVSLFNRKIDTSCHHIFQHNWSKFKHDTSKEEIDLITRICSLISKGK